MEAIDGFEDRVAVAVANGPRSSVLSGELGALDEMIDSLATHYQAEKLKEL
jgi:acyl transferase domain-containing protein